MLTVSRARARRHVCRQAHGSKMTDQDRERLAARTVGLARNSTFALCPRGNGPSSMRLMESMLLGAIPVMLDDWTTPFDDTMADFAVRWSLLYGHLDVLAAVLKALAADPVELARRRAAMALFLQRNYPGQDVSEVSARYLRDKLTAVGL